MSSSLQIHSPLNESETITSEIWETAPSAEIMCKMLWESHGFRQPGQISRYEAHFHLFAAYCARRTSHLLTDQRSQAAIRTAELYAAGAATRLDMHRAQRNAEAAVIQLAQTYSSSPLPTITETKTTETAQPHPGLDPRLALGAALLHAASAAATSCYAHQIFGGLQSAEASANYSSKALYWQALVDHAGSVLITELLEEEDRRQAEALRMIIGNPFNPNRSPAMTLPRQPNAPDNHIHF